MNPILLMKKRAMPIGRWILLASAGVLAIAPFYVLPVAHAGPTYASESVTIPVYNSALGQFTGSPLIDVAFPAASGFAPSTRFTLDTGSTGIAVSAPIWDPSAVGATLLGSGSLTYTSSGRVLQGDWYQAALQIGSGGTTAQTSVPVLFVSTIICQTNSRDCQEDDSPQGVSFFGVGFAREADSLATTPSGTVASIPAYNPLLNITAVNGVPITASTPAQPGATGVNGNYTSGYILTPGGLSLGLTAANTAGFSTLPLTWNDQTNATGFNSGYADWNPVNVSINVNGTSGTGTVLTDSGIDYMILTPTPGTPLQTDSACTIGKDCLAPGSTVALAIGTIASYAFTIGGNGGAPLQPAPPAAPAYAVKSEGMEVFVNTGYHFFNQYDYLYDYVNGQVGYINRVPGPLPLAGAAAVFGWARRLRRRLAAASRV
jgi:hypothetical protein